MFWRSDLEDLLEEQERKRSASSVSLSWLQVDHTEAAAARNAVSL